MRMKPIALGFAGLTVILCLIVGDYDRGDSNLKSFYSEMLMADFPAARRSIDEAIRLWPANARYYAWRAYCSSQKLPPQCPRCFHGTDSAMNAGDQQAAREAMADYRRALELNGRDAVAHHNLAWLEHLFGDDTAADKDWRQATTLDPDDAVFRVSYGMFLEESGNAQTGRDQIEAAIELSPSILDSPFFARYRSHSPEAADSIVAHSVTRLESKLEREKDPILEARLGKLYQYSHNLTRSVELLQDAAKQLPNLGLVWFNLAEAYSAQGDTTRAMEYYRKANVVNGSLTGPYLRMGELYLRTGQKNLAAFNLRLAAERWEHITPITAPHNNRLYNGPQQKIDDLLPTTLVWYLSPCEASDAYRSLAELSPPSQRSLYIQRVNTCEQIPAPHSWPRGD
jgi:tetratricopeptide (TPR) repeat protein